MTVPDRVPALLSAATIGIYLLLIVGATTALSEATTACAAWPACGTGYTTPTEPIGWVALGHRLVAVVVGLLVVAATVAVFRDGAAARVRAATAIVLLAYPIQAGLGAYIATTTTTRVVSVLHLATGIALFATSLAALTWWLEARTGDPSEDPSPTGLAGTGPDLETDPGEADPVAGDSIANDPVETDSITADSASSGSPSIPTGRWPRLAATLRAYFRLMKPRLMWLLCLVAAAAMALATGMVDGETFTPRIVAFTLVGGSLAIGASGTFNHVFERDVDRRMQRTADRPLALDLIPVSHAVAFGLLLTVVSVGLFWLVNPLAAVLGLTAIAFYSVVYTLVLKPNTVQNTVIGGAAGSLPALIGWAAVTGEIGGGGLLLAALIFLWTPAHFYNLALAYRDDYERGGFPMMPVVRGETTTRRHILWYLGATLAAAAVLAAAADALGIVYLVAGVTLGAVFLWAVVRLHYERTEAAAFRAFHASNAYLGVVLIAVVFDSIVV
ncbi:heme o synthase [Halopenitus persicus]|uniref:heme o synthase n=1 Tax=Halopenitus persicus TaxID=1048396 RepID=UPI000BBA888F|nr:heme o synthase [Halopenitus persicus]